MPGVKGRSGGKRPGAGRKPAAPIPKEKRAPTAPPPDATLDAEGYLAAVVAGTMEPHPHRIAAARSLIRFQQAVKRGPIPAPSAQALAKSEATQIERAQRAEFEKRAAAIRAKHGRS